MLEILGCCAWLGCTAHAPTPAPAAAVPARQVAVVPPGCESDLSGAYAYSGSERYQYLATDDGGLLTLRVEGQAPDGGPFSADGGSPQVEVERTPSGFRGVTRAWVTTPAGAPCEVAFPTEILACEGTDAGASLLVRSAPYAHVDEHCRVAEAPNDEGVSPKGVEHRLIRKGPQSANPPSPLGNSDGGPR